MRAIGGRGRHGRGRLLAPCSAITVATLVTACSSGSESTTPSASTGAATTSVVTSGPPATTASSPTATDAATSVVETSQAIDVIAELAAIPEAADASSFPEVEPDAATGVYGYSRYVWTDNGSSVVPLLVEGPLGQQVRCQDVDLPCSYPELAGLAESGDGLPEMNMSAGEIGTLVNQLDDLNSFVASFTSMDQACAAGYSPETEQNPNMGIHMTNNALLADGFNPAQPEMLLWAKPDGETIPRAEIGECTDDGTWTGADGYEIVGAAFLHLIQPDHPEGFAGPIDNWHIHYSACSGSSSDSIQGDAASCEAAGGVFFERTPVWMMHAYAADGFESQEGVFAMYNSSIWPLGADTTLETRRDELGDDVSGARSSPIVNFDYGTIEVPIGGSVSFSNADGAPHTVTAGTPGAASGLFDSGVLGSGGAWTGTFDEPGVISIYCALHPQMTGTIVVE